MKKKLKRREPTSAERERWEKAVQEESRPDVIAANKALGRKVLKKKQKQTAAARQALDILAKLRADRGLSLRDLEKATGITRGNLSRLWNNPLPNVTVETLGRIAGALGAELEITVKV